MPKVPCLNCGTMILRFPYQIKSTSKFFCSNDCHTRHKFPKKEVITRFESKIEISTSGCWEWSGNRNPKGYGMFQNNGVWMSAHRAAWELYNGIIENDLFVCHSCDNPCCVNPDHLWLGTHQDNMDDSVSKDRRLKGEDSPVAILSEDDVREIRYLRDQGLIYKDIASKFGCSPGTVRAVLDGRTWSHVN